MFQAFSKYCRVLPQRQKYSRVKQKLSICYMPHLNICPLNIFSPLPVLSSTRLEWVIRSICFAHLGSGGSIDIASINIGDMLWQGLERKRERKREREKEREVTIHCHCIGASKRCVRAQFLRDVSTLQTSFVSRQVYCLFYSVRQLGNLTSRSK
jgi:hypothetical protein